MKINNHSVSKTELIMTAIIVVLGFIAVCQYMNQGKVKSTVKEKEKALDKAMFELDTVLKVNKAMVDSLKEPIITPDTVYLALDSIKKVKVREVTELPINDKIEYLKSRL